MGGAIWDRRLERPGPAEVPTGLTGSVADVAFPHPVRKHACPRFAENLAPGSVRTDTSAEVTDAEIRTHGSRHYVTVTNRMRVAQREMSAGTMNSDHFMHNGDYA